MNDSDPDAMLTQTLFICACFWLAVLGLVMLSACTPTVKLLDLPPPVQCRTLDLPPVPDDVVLDIKGDHITANEGGELLLRYYSRARQLLKPAAQASTKPTTTP